MTVEESRRTGPLLGVLLTAPFLTQADAAVTNVATPAIRQDLAASDAEVALVVGAYLMAFAVMLVPGARLGQTHGYRRLFRLGLTVIGIASLLGSLAPNATVLIAMRALQGAGAALMFPQALTGIQMNFDGVQRARAIALYAAALSTGAVAGQVLGGGLISADLAGTGWRPSQLINVPVCAVSTLAAARYLPADAPRGGTRLDLLGMVTLSATLLLLIPPLVLGREQGWPGWIWLSLAASVPAFAVFLATQRRRDPLINVALLARRPILLGVLALTVATCTYYVLLFTFAQYAQAGLGRSALASGLILAPWVTAFGLAGPLVRRLPARLARHLTTAGYLLLCLAYLGLALAAGAGSPDDTVLAVLMALGGLGLGTGFVTLLDHLTAATPTRHAPDLSGVSNTALLIGGAVGIATVGTLYLSTRSFALTALVLGSLALIAAGTAFLAVQHRTANSVDGKHT